MNQKVICSVCASLESHTWGGMNTHTRIDLAGIEADIYPNGEYEVLKCLECGLAKKYPFADETALTKLYQASPADQWGFNQDASDRHFEALEELARPNHTPGPIKVLDYGCSNGDLLASWGNAWDKFGIELSEQAKEIATTRGINVIEETELELTPNHFDAIVMVDVIEHLTNPIKTFSRLINSLKPNGKLLIITGDTDSIGFTLAKGSYWYCDIPEHIIFFNEKSLDTLFDSLNVRKLTIDRISHTKTNSRHLKLVKPFIKFSLFHFYKVVNRYLPFIKLSRTTYPNTHAFKDHLLAVYQKKVQNRVVSKTKQVD